MKKISLLAGVSLIALGALTVLFNLALIPSPASLARWAPWRLWPVFVVGLGILILAIPLVKRKRRGLGILLIIGAPVLLTGAILLVTNTLGSPRAWRWLWPLEVMSFAAGLLLAAVRMRAPGLLVPGIVILANGAVCQFCAVTGWWRA